MYVRLVQARSRPGLTSKIQQLYDGEIIPRLRKMPGCLCSYLVQSDFYNNEGISITLWDSEAHAEEYEKSGLFKQMLDIVKPYLSDSSEWKIQLSKEHKLEFQQIPEEPVLKAYTSFAHADLKDQSDNRLTSMHLRVLSLTVKPGMMEEFRRLYKDKILTTLHKVKGCRYAFMTENIQDRSEVLSLTIWDSKQDAVDYENSEMFTALIDKVKHTFSGIFHWKVELEKESGDKVITTEDPHSRFYTIVTGKFFNS